MNCRDSSGTLIPQEMASVLSLLPHRPPFLLVDRVIASEPGHWIHATRLLTAGDPLLTEQGTLPAPLLIEAIAQTAAALLLSENPGVTPALLGIERAIFRGEARVGDVLHLYAEVCRLRQRIGRAQGKAVNDSGMTLCEAEFTFGWSLSRETR